MKCMILKIICPLLPSLKKKKLPTKTSSKDDELSPKADIWKTLNNQMTHGASNTNNFPKQDGFTLEDKAQRLG